MRVIVFGASGFLGSWAVRALLADGHDVTTVGRPGTDAWRLAGLDRRQPHGGLTMLRAVPADWPALIATSAADAVLSLDWSGTATADHSDAGLQRANLDRQRAVLEAVATAGVQRFVGVGSQTEYGVQVEPITEQDPIAPVTAYGSAKAEAQAQGAVFAAEHGIRWVWARVFSLYGPLDGEGRLLPSIMDAADSGQRIALTPATQPWSYLAAEDAGRALALLATHPDAEGAVNVAHPEAPPLREHIERFATAAGAEHLLDFGAIAPGPNSSTRIADVSRLRALGWEPASTIDESLTRTARWLGGTPTPDPLLPELTLPARRR